MKIGGGHLYYPSDNLFVPREGENEEKRNRRIGGISNNRGTNSIRNFESEDGAWMEKFVGIDKEEVTEIDPGIKLQRSHWI